MPVMTVKFNRGVVTARDRADLREGELQQATGIRYKPGDTSRAHKINGRSVAGDTTTALGTQGLALCQFDQVPTPGTDYLIALSSNKLMAGTPGPTVSFATTLSATENVNATNLSAAHALDRWYIANGYDALRALDPNGTLRNAGMLQPVLQPVGTPSSAAVSVNRPPGPEGTSDIDRAGTAWTNPGKAYDASGIDTFAHIVLAVAGNGRHEWFNWASSTASDRILNLAWSLNTIQYSVIDAPTDRPVFGSAGTVDMGATVTVLIEYTVDNGSNWVTWLNKVNMRASNSGVQFLQVPLSVNSNLVRVRATLTYTQGTTPVAFRIYDMNIATAIVANFTTGTGMYYAYTEFDSTRPEVGESPVGPPSALVTLTNQNKVSLTLPAAATNARATHRRIYRTVDGGEAPVGLYLIAELPIAQTSYVDFFDLYDKDTASGQLLPLLGVVAAEDPLAIQTQYYPRDSPPPPLKFVTSFKGSLVGISRLNPRTLAYSLPGRPESWPEIYAIESFPMPERDDLVVCGTVGDTLVVAATGLMFTIFELPQAAIGRGTFDAADIRPLRGQPGCVGTKAFATYSISGEPRAAWVSLFGIHETNGTNSRRLSVASDWPADLDEDSLATSVLFFDPSLQCLIFSYVVGAAGHNNRFLLLHMAPEHETPEGLPAITGPHYGSISCMVGGQVGSVYRRYSGQSSGPIVYLENDGLTDTSASYSGNQLPLIVKTPRLYGPEMEQFAVYRGNLRHTALAAQNITVQYVTGRDQRDTTQTASKTVSLANQKGTDFFVGLGGDWAEVTLTHTGAGDVALLDMRLDLLRMGKAGRVA